MSLAAAEENHPLKAAIFDIDGTLIDSVDFHAKAWQAAFQQFGHEIPFDQIRAQIGKGGDQLMPVFLSKEEVEARGDEIEKYRGTIFKKEFLPEVKPFPKVRDLFEHLLADHWKLALASSAKKDELQIYKEICEITDLLDTETSSDDASESKPHPDIFLAAKRRLGYVAPKDCLIIGDSPYDAEAAAKAHMTSIGVLCGGFEENLLRESGFQTIYRDPSDLLAHYKEASSPLHQVQVV